MGGDKREGWGKKGRGLNMTAVEKRKCMANCGSVGIPRKKQKHTKLVSTN